MKKQDVVYSIHLAFADRHYVVNKSDKQLKIWDAYAAFYMAHDDCPPMKFITWKDEHRISKYDGQPIIHDVVTSTKSHMRKFMRLYGIKRSQKDDADLKDYTIEVGKKEFKEHKQKMQKLKTQRLSAREPEQEGDTQPRTSTNHRGSKISFAELRAAALEAMPVSYDELFNKVLKGTGGNRRQDVIDVLVEDGKIEEFKENGRKWYRLKGEPEYVWAPKEIQQPEVQEAIREEIKKGIQSLAPEYVKPSPQPALDGEMGLTSEDLARSLGVTLSSVNEKCSRIDPVEWQEDGYRVIVNAISPLSRKPSTEYVFTVDAAKYFIGTWKNKIGRGYFRYLLDCEKVVESRTPANDALAQSLRSLSDVVARMGETTVNMVNNIESRVQPMREDVTENTQRHDDAMLSASQQAICNTLWPQKNKQFKCSIAHSLIKKAAKAKFRPDATASDCTWHKIRQSDFEGLVEFIENWEPSELDVKRIKRFWATDNGKKDRKRWGLD